MSQLEKQAWFNIGVLAVACLLFGLTCPHLGVLRATGSLGLVGLCGLSTQLLFRKGKMVLDERESSIRLRATRIAHSLFWMIFVSSFMSAWFLHRGNEIAIRADVLPAMVFSAFIFVLLVESVATLLLFKTGAGHEE